MPSGTDSKLRVLRSCIVCRIPFSDKVIVHLRASPIPRFLSSISLLIDHNYNCVFSDQVWKKHQVHRCCIYLNCSESQITCCWFCWCRRRAFRLGTNWAFLIKPRIPLKHIVRGFSAQLPLEARRLEGKVAIITGGASGFGEATARTFVAHGAKVVIGDTDDEEGGRVSASLHPHAHFLHCNVAQEEDVSALVDLAVSRHGHLDIMFNNAGITGRGFGTPAEMSIEDFQRVMDVNVRGVVSGVKHAARAMMERNKGGSILCTASIASVWH